MYINITRIARASSYVASPKSGHMDFFVSLTLLPSSSAKNTNGLTVSSNWRKGVVSVLPRTAPVLLPFPLVGLREATTSARRGQRQVTGCAREGFSVFGVPRASRRYSVRESSLLFGPRKR